MSLWGLDDGVPHSFAAGEPDGMSSLMRHFVAGMIAHARDITYLLAPNINSYKRFVAGTFAPTTSAWSFDNRTAGFRLVGQDSKALRIECRIGGADLNPYLAYAGLIAAGIDGIARKLVLAPPITGDSYELENLPRIPTTLRDAVDAFAESKMLTAAFGERVIAHYVHAGRWEQKCYDTQVTDWELRRGLEQA
jgi:glutamine synthetase